LACNVRGCTGGDAHISDGRGNLKKRPGKKKGAPWHRPCIGTCTLQKSIEGGSTPDIGRGKRKGRAPDVRKTSVKGGGEKDGKEETISTLNFVNHGSVLCFFLQKREKREAKGAERGGGERTKREQRCVQNRQTHHRTKAQKNASLGRQGMNWGKGAAGVLGRRKKK